MARYGSHPDAERVRPAYARIRAGQRTAFGVAVLAILAAISLACARPDPANAAPRPGPRFTETGEPADLHDLSGWLEYKARHHVASLPTEARLFHRLALLAEESGEHADAMRLMRGAGELDPGFVAPHLTLAAWSLTREPSQALLQYATVLELARRNFMLQLALSANAIYLALQALYLGLLAAGVLVVVIRVHALRHPWEEALGRWLSPETARWWSWAFVVLPYVAGFGVVLPTLVFLGLLWTSFRWRERVLAVTLTVAAAGTPVTAMLLDRLAAPLDGSRAPLFGVPMIEHDGWTPERAERLARFAAQHPDNPYLRFAQAWTQRQAGDAAAAEKSWRAVLELWPGDAAALNNLGNALAMQGRADDALASYLAATRANPDAAPAWFNASQIYTQRFAYEPANDAIARASALDFEMVKAYQAQGADGTLALVDQWIAPGTFWSALGSTPVRSGRGSLPPSWRGRLEASGWLFSAAALAAMLIGLGASMWLHRRTPLRNCSNCGRVVCRRCARRRRELALCPDCEVIESRAESPEFARLMLGQRRRRVDATERMMRTAGATLIPGFGLLARHHVFTPVFLLSLAAALSSGQLGMAPPFAYEPRLLTGGSGLPVPLTAALWVLVFAWSLLGYFRIEARARAQAAQIAAPVRSRVTQATRQQTADAA
jgi:tetratricopeptide (TPR) repeat protein